MVDHLSFTYLLKRQRNHLWCAMVEELTVTAASDQPTPRAALQAARAWMKETMESSSKSLTFEPNLLRCFLGGSTTLGCGCLGTQVHAFNGKPLRIHVTTSGLWANAKDMDLIPEIPSPMGASADHESSWSVYGQVTPWPDWDPQDRTIPATRTDDATLVCACIRTIDDTKQRRIVQPSMVPIHEPLANPFAIVRM